MLRGHPSGALIFNRFLIDFWMILVTPELTKYWKVYGDYNVFFASTLFQDKIDLRCHFDANLAPFSIQKSTKIRSKIDFRRHQNFDRCSDPFFFDFGSILDARTAQDAPKMAPRRPQDGPKRLQDAPRPPGRPPGLPRQPQDPTGPRQMAPCL